VLSWFPYDISFLLMLPGQMLLFPLPKIEA
jgi:hypothetical protein